MSQRYFLVVSFLIFLLSGCGETVDAPTSSDRKITNGKLITEDVYPPVVKIRINRGKINAECTATITGDNSAITAAHCVENWKEVSIVLASPAFQGKKAIAVHTHPRFNSNKGGGDVAMLVFPDRSFTQFYRVTLDANEIKVGRPLLMVGFGKTNDRNEQSGGKKTMGRNVITDRERIETNFSVIGVASGAGTGENTSLSNGDSGGPALLEDRQNAIAGIASYKFNSRGGGAGHGGGYTNLSYGEHADWLRSIANGGVRIAGINTGMNVNDPNIDTTRYLAYLYRVVLERTADAAGFEYWSGRLKNGASFCDATDGFVRSEEFRQRQAIEIYRQLFGGNLQGEALNYWAAVMATSGRKGLLTEVLNHPEYAAIAARTMPGANNSEKFVEALFVQLIGYPPKHPSTRAAVASLGDALARGIKTKAQLIEEFLRRADYIAHRVNVLHQRFLGRENASPVEIWMERFITEDEFSVGKMILCSEEAQKLSQR